MKTKGIALRRIRNSGLSGTRFDTPEEVVRRHGAMQAQDYGPAKWSIAQRAEGLRDHDLDDALAKGSIVRTHALRPTWHFLAAEDARWVLRLTGPRVHKQNGPRYRELGLDGKTLARCQKVLASALEGGNHLTRNELAQVLRRARIDDTGQRLPYILMHCELEATIGSGPLSGKRHTYALLDERLPEGPPFDRDVALVELTRRYLQSHGPASIQDFRWWSNLTVGDIKGALDALGSEAEERTIEGETFWWMASDEPPLRKQVGAHLLQTYDETIVGYSATRFFGDPREAETRAARRDRTLPTGVALMNGRLAGHWRRTIKKSSVEVEVLAYEDPKPAVARAVRAAAAELGNFLEREVTVDFVRL